MNNKKYILASNVLLSCIATSLFASDNTEIDSIEVVSKKLKESANSVFIGNKTVLDQEELINKRAPTLGETLEKTAGIQSEHFGPNSGRPVIRSLSGSRVSILSNNLAVPDMSIISSNLPTPIEPFMAEKIEVIKGAASVLYGGGAIGGSVNIDDGRIPDHIDEQSFKGKVDVSTGYNAPNTQMFRLDGNNGSNWAWHLSGLHRKISSYKIPGKAKSNVCYDHAEAGSNTPLRDLCQVDMKTYDGGVNPAYYPYLSQYIIDNPEAADGERDRYTWRRTYNISRRPWYGVNPANPLYVEGTENDTLPSRKGPLTDIVPLKDGEIPNSHLTTKSFTIGTSYIGEKWYAGIALNQYKTEYGVPGFVYTDALSNKQNQGLGFKPANIKSSQTRWDVKAAVDNPIFMVDNASLSLSYSKAENNDYLGDTLSSGLESKGKQARVEINHTPIGIISGVFGASIGTRDITSLGTDSYLPSNKTKEKAFFIVERATLGPVSLELGTRFDVVKYKYKDDSYIAGNGADKHLRKDHRFSLRNHHAGINWQVNENWYVKAQRSFGERAPEVNELYASNLHLANLTREEGSSEQEKEQADTWELSTGFEYDAASLDISLYRTKFINYSYLGFTGVSNGDERSQRKQWRQHDALVKGIEFNFKYRFLSNNSGDWTINLLADFVKNKPIYHKDGPAKRLAGEYMPGMPTSRYGGELSWQRKGWQAGIGAIKYTKQKNVGKVINDEPSLPGYTLVDARLSYIHKMRTGSLEGYLVGKNLTNREARPFNSTLKYLTPLPGRSVVAGVRWSF